eukprot:gene1896-2151_t
MATEQINEFKLGDDKIEIVSNFLFLGSKIEDNGTCRSEITRRLNLGRAAMTGLAKIWKDKNITTSTKTKVVETLVFPVVMYGCESWT